MLRVNPEERISLEEVNIKFNQVLKLCNIWLTAIEENKPKIDPIIIMEDIIEKFRLINFEIQYCKKFNKPLIGRMYFACPLKGNIYSNNNTNFAENYIQFTNFIQISHWLAYLIREVRYILFIRLFKLENTYNSTE